MQESIKNLIGKRVLMLEGIDRYGSREYPQEVEILELSPSEKWVKIRFPSGSARWAEVRDIEIVEILD